MRRAAAPRAPPFSLNHPLSPSQVAHFYFRSARVVRGVRYGLEARHTVDVYLPRAVATAAGTSAAGVVAAAAAAVAAGRKAPAPPAASTAPSPALPVIIYITGGAWTVGHSAWGALLARRLSSGGRPAAKGGAAPTSSPTPSPSPPPPSPSSSPPPSLPADPCIVICVDYRNWPAASAAASAADVSAAIGWALAATPWLGGDAGRVHLVGQSCGAQLGGLALVGAAGRVAGVAAGCGAAAVAALLEQAGAGLHCAHHATWPASAIASFIGVSGVYDLDALALHLEARGIGAGGGGRRWLEAVAAGPKASSAPRAGARPPPSLAALSPAAALASACPVALDALPRRFALLHGDADGSSPLGQAARFEAVLRRSQPGPSSSAPPLSTTLTPWPGATHTSPLVEGPLRGGDADLLTGAVRAVVRGDPGNGRGGAVAAAAAALPAHRHPPGPPRRLCPEWLVGAAAAVCPF